MFQQGNPRQPKTPGTPIVYFTMACGAISRGAEGPALVPTVGNAVIEFADHFVPLPEDQGVRTANQKGQGQRTGKIEDLPNYCLMLYPF